MKVFCLLFSVLCLSSVACGPVALSSAGSTVRAVKSDAPDGCKELGVVQGDDGSGIGGRYESALNDARNDAAKLGGNYLRIDSIVLTAGSRVTGVAYACPAASKDPKGD